MQHKEYSSMNTKNALLVFLLSAFLSACSTSSRVGMLSTRNIDYSATYVKGNSTSYSAHVTLILFVPIEFDDLNDVEVVDMALKKEGYEFLTNATITHKGIFTLLFNSATFTVEGTGWKKGGATTEIDSPPNTKFAYSVTKTKEGYDLKKVDVPQ
jgi:hypothetical protein